MRWEQKLKRHADSRSEAVEVTDSEILELDWWIRAGKRSGSCARARKVDFAYTCLPFEFVIQVLLAGE